MKERKIIRIMIITCIIILLILIWIVLPIHKCAPIINVTEKICTLFGGLQN